MSEFQSNHVELQEGTSHRWPDSSEESTGFVEDGPDHQLETSIPCRKILAIIADYMTVSDLLRFARVSRRMQEMVYDDSRWIQRLSKMGCWNESVARKRVESNHTEGRNTPASPRQQQSISSQFALNGVGRPPLTPRIIFDSTITSPPPVKSPSSRKAFPIKSTLEAHRDLADGFDATTLTSPGGASKVSPLEQESALTILRHVHSVRGQARQEYGKVYKALGSFYNDATETQSPMDCQVFKTFESPEQQAQMLAQLETFARSDFAPGAGSRSNRLAEIISIFDTAALLEFRKGYDSRDIAGTMRKYAHVLYALNRGKTSIDLFLSHNSLIKNKAALGSSTDCIDYSSGHGHVSLERTQTFFDRLLTVYGEENGVVRLVFESSPEVEILFLEKVGQDVLTPYLSSLFDEAHSRGIEAYLETVSGTFAQTLHFVRDLPLDPKIAEAEQPRINAVISSIFELHLDLYLAEELAFFRHSSDAEVEKWDQALSEQAASTETFLMSNINRQADKKDFMSSFKKVVMMPVNILPGFPTLSGNKSTAKALVNGESADTTAQSETKPSSRPSTPVNTGTSFYASSPARTSTPLPIEAPTTELAAKAALMNIKLETIRSLFSIEVALNLVHSAKASLERAALFVALGGNLGEAAKQQCSAIFVLLLQTLGIRHVKAGFDKAVSHLSVYNPREVNNHTHTNDSSTAAKTQVAPLATFLELVNVGDLIQQMLDVFYESELIRLRLSTRDDFLDPAVKEKKKFEQMLDERVAAGLARGIDVLMDQIEYVCATSQLPTDFNPSDDTSFDIGPTTTAKTVVELVGSHTAMLNGSTDKTLLDVFSTEIGLRLFATLCKHLKRQRISTSGALPLLSDLSYYARFVSSSIRNHDLDSYFTALREVGQIYLIDGGDDTHNQEGVREMGSIIADAERYRGVFTVEEVLEFAERRADWLLVKGRVERAMYGQGCVVM